MDYKIILATLVFILLDIICGLIKAIKNGEFKSSYMRQGLMHKVGEVLAIVFGFCVDYFGAMAGITLGTSILAMICLYIILMEFGSIAENIGEISPEVADVLAHVMDKFEKK